mmetsp:Transcript_123321/g.356376  ORF Transcript_123321/g.356376 Transcript_123321/m.356376 type:complete len:310 (-) Transcript_123321:1887-2816(-)
MLFGRGLPTQRARYGERLPFDDPACWSNAPPRTHTRLAKGGVAGSSRARHYTASSNITLESPPEPRRTSSTASAHGSWPSPPRHHSRQCRAPRAARGCATRAARCRRPRPRQPRSREGARATSGTQLRLRRPRGSGANSAHCDWRPWPRPPRRWRPERPPGSLLRRGPLRPPCWRNSVPGRPRCRPPCRRHRRRSRASCPTRGPRRRQLPLRPRRFRRRLRRCWPACPAESLTWRHFWSQPAAWQAACLPTHRPPGGRSRLRRRRCPHARGCASCLISMRRCPGYCSPQGRRPRAAPAGKPRTRDSADA